MAKKLLWIHFTARIRAGVPALVRPGVGAWLWAHLREAFATAIACVLMPDHLHLLLATLDVDAQGRRLARLLGQLGRRFGEGGEAGSVKEPKVLRSGLPLAREVRYIALNPCRAGLTRCPLAWTWSTHRDVVGAVVDPWVTDERLAEALVQPRMDFARTHHAYVSGDPHAHVAGTPFPIAAEATTLPAFPLRTIAEASVAALREPLAAIRTHGPARALFVALAREQGWWHAEKLARSCDCSPRTIERLAAATSPTGLAAARLCLGDERLRLTRASLAAAISEHRQRQPDARVPSG